MTKVEHIFLHSLLESIRIVAFVFTFNVLLSFVETYFTDKFAKNSKINPLTGSLFGLIPQCGVSVIGADLYVKNHITLGTIIAIFIACSDEAIPIILSSDKKAIYIIPLILCKIIIGCVVGYLIDLIYRISKEKVQRSTGRSAIY